MEYFVMFVAFLDRYLPKLAAENKTPFLVQLEKISTLLNLRRLYLFEEQGTPEGSE